MKIYLLILPLLCIGCIQPNADSERLVVESRLFLEVPDLNTPLHGILSAEDIMIGGESISREAFAILLIQGHGDTNDIPLIAQYLDSEDPITSRYAKECIEVLEK